MGREGIDLIGRTGFSATAARAARAALVGLALSPVFAGTALVPARAEAPGETLLAGGEMPLTEDQVARFSASLARMHGLGQDVALALRGEFNNDDPLAPYAVLVEEAREPAPEIAAALSAHGFATLEEWLAVGAAVMTAYWTHEADATHLGLAVQLAPIVFAVRGRANPSAQEVSDLIDELQADMTEWSERQSPAANLRLVGKYRGAIGEALRVRP
jgi:hypothetical protein